MVASLTSRPLDLLYFVFFLTHIPATLLLDLQSLYPTAMIPSFIRMLPKLYTDMSSDPLVAGAMGYLGEDAMLHLVWFKTFVVVEMIFQLPTFILGLWGLWTGSRSIYVLMLIYGASTATTTLPCLSVLLATPVSSYPIEVHSITPDQRLLLLSSYVPYFLIPLGMTVDMAFRISKLVKANTEATTEKKSN
ncbi:transmembrane protein 6/97 [Hygrophoropsis aurantiaca]|uniref:Transmembrane protein 6/97 n=1 Tax=Hygrophoropsis aurantiaca TaxID=72124 RepID=A0ACB8ANU2_9AGAM|nr:transmembrane protein 6/97 [Hygrophoropsis aurantiaca]